MAEVGSAKQVWMSVDLPAIRAMKDNCLPTSEPHDAALGKRIEHVRKKPGRLTATLIKLFKTVADWVGRLLERVSLRKQAQAMRPGLSALLGVDGLKTVKSLDLRVQFLAFTDGTNELVRLYGGLQDVERRSGNAAFSQQAAHLKVKLLDVITREEDPDGPQRPLSYTEMGEWMVKAAAVQTLAVQACMLRDQMISSFNGSWARSGGKGELFDSRPGSMNGGKDGRAQPLIVF